MGQRIGSTNSSGDHSNQALPEPKQTQAGTHATLGSVQEQVNTEELSSTKSPQPLADPAPSTKLTERKVEVSDPGTRSGTPGKKSKQVRFNEQPVISDHITRSDLKENLRERALTFLNNREQEDLIDLLATQYLNDLTTRASDERRDDGFEQLSKDLLDRVDTEDKDFLTNAIDTAEMQIDAHIGSTLKVLEAGRTNIDEKIEELQAKIERLSKTPSNAAKVNQLNALVDELQVVKSVLSPPNKSDRAAVSNVIHKEQAPQISILRLLLETGNNQEAEAFIQRQRNPAIVQKMLQMLSGAYEAKHLIEVAKKRLARLTS